jgi:hypothetical protein
MAAGALLIIFGVWIAARVLKGNLVDRLAGVVA